MVSFPSDFSFLGNSHTSHMEALEAAIGQVAPQWRPKGPPGGFIASELKKIHDDSVSVFPESVYNGEGRRQARWATTMKTDYIPIAIMREQAEIRKGVTGHMGNNPADDVGVSGTMGNGKYSVNCVLIIGHCLIIIPLLGLIKVHYK